MGKWRVGEPGRPIRALSPKASCGRAWTQPSIPGPKSRTSLGQLGGRWEWGGVGRELGPENPQARETGSANGQVQRKHSWGGAKVFIMLGLQLQTELMDGAAPVPINSLSLPPSTPALQPSMFSATTAPTVSIEIWVGGQGGKGEEKRGVLHAGRNWREMEGGERKFALPHHQPLLPPGSPHPANPCPLSLGSL